MAYRMSATAGFSVERHAPVSVMRRAVAAIFVLHAHAARKPNSQVGLEAAIRCETDERRLCLWTGHRLTDIGIDVAKDWSTNQGLDEV